MRIFKTKAFHQWANETGLSDEDLLISINDITKGLFEANLGGNIYKKRIALPGRGKSAGVRTIIAYKADKHTFFVYGFAKNVRDNISDKELIALKKLAKLYFGLSDEQMSKAIKSAELIEVIS